MRKIVSGLFMSLDGIVDADDDWQFSYFDEEMFAELTAAWERASAALMGRRSFEGYNALRTDHPDSPMLGFLERVDRYVVSTTITETHWPGTAVLRDDVFDRLAALKDQPGGDILVCGSPSVLRGLLGHGLLDELNLVILPILVGSGGRLFLESSAGDLNRLPLKLANSTAFDSGALSLQYVP
jgi:dihydrofolate reductase